MTARKRKITEARLVRAIKRDEDLGFCTGCGAERGGCEPDAREYPCEECGEDKVYGAEELLLCGAGL